MRLAICAATMLLLFTACKKDFSLQESSITADAISNNALAPLPCHTTEFKSDYPILAGQVPPFRFKKTLYIDTRVKTINMMSRVFPIHQFYQRHAVELTGTFTYGSNRAYLKGSRRLWEHYKYNDGTTRKLLSTTNVNLKFYFTPEGYCTRVTDLDRSNSTHEYGEYTLLNVVYEGNYSDGVTVLDYISVKRSDRLGNADGWIYYNPRRDQYGNTLDFYFPYNPGGDNSYPTYQYDYNIKRGTKNYSFIPSQNLISQEYSLLEVMQWVPQPTHQRKAVAGVFFLPDRSRVVQSQVYKNYQFDLKGNQVSVTYGDNVPQRTTWFCK